MPDGAPETGQPAEPAADDLQGRDGKRRRSFLTETVVLFGVALVIAMLTKSFVVQPFYIPSASMEDTLLIGRIRSAPAPSHNPLASITGETMGWLVNEVEGLFVDEHGQTDYIKRVIGVPGDHVACCNA